jgi:hypothetical protein
MSGDLLQRKELRAADARAAPPSALPRSAWTMRRNASRTSRTSAAFPAGFGRALIAWRRPPMFCYCRLY